LGAHKIEQSTANNPEGRVLRFRPRGSNFARPLTNQSPVKDLTKFERDAGPDDYRHRMMMNAAGLAVAVILVAGGMWIANTMAQMRKNEDCVLTGRRGCTPVEVPIQPRW
jgi:hypothetical protein